MVEENTTKDKIVMFTNKLEASENPLRYYSMTEYLKLGNATEYLKTIFSLL